jgi:hypothetical protein
MQVQADEITRLLMSWRECDRTALSRLLSVIERKLNQIAHLRLRPLPALDEGKSKLLETHYFGGLSGEKTAEASGVAPNTVIHDWNFARAWFQMELRGELAGRMAAAGGTLATD